MSVQRKEIGTGNYDVLLERAATSSETHQDDDHDVSPEYVLFQQDPPHVGNNRFQVMLSMYKAEYEESNQSEAGADKVVQKIVDIVCNQCVPPGRFLEREQADTPSTEKAEADHWKPLSGEKVLEFIKKQMDLLTGTKEEESGDGEKKRRRRSSLLRRSVSEGNILSDSKKKSSRNIIARFKEGSGSQGEAHVEGKEGAADWDSTPKNGKPKRFSFRTIFSNRSGPVASKSVTKIDRAEALDIVFNDRLNAFTSKNHTGNNRLKVLMDVQRNRFQAASGDDRLKIVEELTDAVTKHWGGRFLSESEQGEGYDVLDAERSSSTLLLCMATAENGDLQENGGMDSLEVKPLVTTSSPSFSPLMTDENLRNAALQSLQKRKKRQGLTSRIRNLAANTLTRSSSVPSSALPQRNIPPAKKDFLRSTSAGQATFRASTADFSHVPIRSHSVNFADPIHEVDGLQDLSETLIEDLLAGLDVSGELKMPANPSERNNDRGS